MNNTRKSLFTIIFDNLATLFNLATLVLIVIFVVNKQYLFTIPLILSLLSIFITLYLDIYNYHLTKDITRVLHRLDDRDREEEISVKKLKVGDEVVLRINDVTPFVSKVIKGTVYVDENKINGSSAYIKKAEGSFIKQNSIIINGSAVVEIIDFNNGKIRRNKVQNTPLFNRIKNFNFVFGLVSVVLLSILLIRYATTPSFDLVRPSECVLICLPTVFNFLSVIYFLIMKRRIKNVRFNDITALSALDDIDVICLDKTGTITNGEYEVFKSVPISSTSFGSVSSNISRTFEQHVSNVIRSTKETGGYFDALQKYYHYDVAKIIDVISPIKLNGLYSAVTFSDGKTYALGEVENFAYTNNESVNNAVNQYRSLGYRVLMLVESKKPLKHGYLDGKVQGIGLIVLREKIRENIANIIKMALENNKRIKIISGDELQTNIEAARKVGLDSVDKCMSLKGVSFEQLSILIDNQYVFSDASMSHKEFIVTELQKAGHKVCYIGDGDNDTLALKAADISICFDSSTKNARKCAQIIIDEEYDDVEDTLIRGRLVKRNVEHAMNLFYARSVFGSLFAIAFLIANFFDSTIVNPFTYSHLLLFTAFGVYLPSIFILFDSSERKTINSNFRRNIVADSLMLIMPVAAILLLQYLQYKGVGYFYLTLDYSSSHMVLMTSESTYNLCYLALLLSSLFVVFRHMLPMNKTRFILFLITILFPLAYFVLLGFDIRILDKYTFIDSQLTTVPNYFIGGLCVLISGALYLFIMSLIEIIKGENIDVKD